MDPTDSARRDDDRTFVLLGFMICFVIPKHSKLVRPGTPSQGDFIVIRYEGPKGGPGMREMLTPTPLGRKCLQNLHGRRTAEDMECF